jgi:hypothetical protein
MALYNSTDRNSGALTAGPLALMSSSQSLQQPAGASGKQRGADSSKSRHAKSQALVPTAQQQRKAASHQQPLQQQQHGYDAQQFSPAGFFQSYSGAAAAAALPGTSWPQLLSPPLGGFNSKFPQYNAGPGLLLPAVDAKPAASNKTGWQLHRPPALQLLQQQQSPQGKLASKGSSSAAPSGSYAQLHQQQHGKGLPGADAAAKRKQQQERYKSKKPDRFAEGAKNAAMIAAMASRW